jgi:hypothetical protein
MQDPFFSAYDRDILSTQAYGKESQVIQSFNKLTAAA